MMTGGMDMEINLSKLSSSKREDRIKVIDSILENRSISSLETLIDHLKNETDRAIKEKIANILTLLLPDSGAGYISKMIKSEDSFTRNCAVEIMKKADDSVVRILAELAGDNNKDVRKFAIDSLITRDTPEVRSILRTRLKDSDPNVVYTAVEYLGTLKDKESIVPIENLALDSDNNPMLFCTCLEALAKIGVHACNEEILSYCKHSNQEPLFRYSILKYLGCCASYETIESYILDLAGKSGETFAKEIIDTMEAVCQRIPDLTIRPKLKELLRRLIFSVEARENQYELTKLLADNLDVEQTRAGARLDLKSDDPMVVLAAIEILGKYGQESDIIAMENLAENTDSDEILEAIGDSVERITIRIGENSL
jgi:HEAT repeat protein